MKKIFICSPYRGNIENNISKAKQYCKKAIEEGYIPIAPHLYFPLFLDDKKENERCIGIDLGIELLKECFEIWVFGNPTEGMKKEIQYAKILNKNIKYF